jgi:hypothetical protein
MSEVNNNMETRSKYKLTDIGNEQPFNTPAGYFEMLEDQIMSKIEQPQLPAKRESLLFYLKPVLGIAASFALVFLLVYYPMKAITSKNAQVVNETVSFDLEFLPQTFINDHDLIESLERMEQSNFIEEAVIETVLLASLSDVELMELN